MRHFETTDRLFPIVVLVGGLLRGRFELYQRAHHAFGFTGFFVIAFMLSLLVFIGEAVRDAFDPRKTMR